MKSLFQSAGAVVEIDVGVDFRASRLDAGSVDVNATKLDAVGIEYSPNEFIPVRQARRPADDFGVFLPPE